MSCAIWFNRAAPRCQPNVERRSGSIHTVHRFLDFPPVPQYFVERSRQLSRVDHRVLGRRLVLPIAIGATVLTVVLSYLWKSTCVGPTFYPNGNSVITLAHGTQYLCLTDIQSLWISRSLNLHLVPYIHGVFVPSAGSRAATLLGGTVEYPVLAGLLIWFAGLFATTDGQFLLSNAVILGICAVATTILLYRLVGPRVLIWACAPALVLYSVYNWDIPPALATVAGVSVMLKGPAGWSPRKKAIVAAILFGVGGALKIYPLLFVLPLALWIFWGAGQPGNRGPRRGNLPSALAVVGAALGVMVLVNLPFMLISFKGWYSAIDFQTHRLVTPDTLSIWYWGLHYFVDPGSGGEALTLISLASSAAVVVVSLAIAVIGWRVAQRTGVYPWLAASAALVCGYMLFNKVDSPQYILWLVPFFAMIRIRSRWIIAYYLTDVALFVGWFEGTYHATIHDGVWIYGHILVVAIWVRAALLLCLIAVFLRAGADEALGVPSSRMRDFARLVRRPLLTVSRESTSVAVSPTGSGAAQ